MKRVKCVKLINEIFFLLQDIKKNMKNYNTRFNIEDKMRESTASKVSLKVLKWHEWYSI